MALSHDHGLIIWDALVAGTRRLDEMSTDQIADLCRWNDSNGEWDDITEADRPCLLEIVEEWLAESRNEGAPNGCAECERSNGPHFTGPCEHN